MADVEAVFPMPDRHQAELRAAGELERLPGVVTAAVWLDNSGQLRDARLHVMPGAAPTIISNAASRVLQALGITFDPRAIRTAPIVLPGESAAPAPAAQPRNGRLLLFQDLTLTRSGNHVSCRVQLARDQNVANGESRELDTAAGRCRAAANATLRAAENAVSGVALGLEGAVVSQIFGRSYATVSVEASAGRRIATLAALVAVDPARAPEEAFCMATLRAIDRWLSL
jgi:hypothetical protein